MQPEQFIPIFEAYLAGSSSKEQLDALLDTLRNPANKEWISPLIQKQLMTVKEVGTEDPDQLIELQRRLDEKLDAIFDRIDEPAHNVNGKSLWKLWQNPWWAVAAAVVIIFTGLFWLNRPWVQPTASEQTARDRPDFKPATNKAILTVDGGSQIYLDSNTTEIIGTQGDASVASVNGQLRYTPQHPGDKIVYNTLSTSRGNQYSLVLPDGTKVWLNAASSITYPVNFVGPTREVEVSGELYFKVIHNEKQPFIVKAKGQFIEDIGTSFNVYAYPDENTFSTTLVEGVVKIAGTLLKPGTQAIIRNGDFSVRQVDTSQVIAWKNGLFAFHQTPVKEVMQQLARWYDVDVEYENGIPEMRFGGKISRSSNASVVLTILEKSGLNFRIEGRKIIVSGNAH